MLCVGVCEIEGELLGVGEVLDVAVWDTVTEGDIVGDWLDETVAEGVPDDDAEPVCVAVPMSVLPAGQA